MNHTDSMADKIGFARIIDFLNDKPDLAILLLEFVRDNPDYLLKDDPAPVKTDKYKSIVGWKRGTFSYEGRIANLSCGHSLVVSNSAIQGEKFICPECEEMIPAKDKGTIYQETLEENMERLAERNDESF